MLPNGGRPLRVIKLLRPYIKVLKPAETYQEVELPEIKSYVPAQPSK